MLFPLIKNIRAMADRVRVSCIKKRDRKNPHERIEGIGGVHNQAQWYMLEDAAIAAIKNHQWDFYVHEGGYTARVIVATHLGREYLKTERDGVSPDNLLSLPTCP